MAKGFDTTANCTSNIAKIKADGMGFVARYYSHSTWKDIQKEEAQALSKAGIYLVAVWESAGDHRDFFTYHQGVVDGAASIAYGEHLGQPHTSPIYFAVDYDAAYSDIENYFLGIRYTFQKRGAIGRDIYFIGDYGPGAICKSLYNKGLVSHTWLAQAQGWSGYKEWKASGNWNILQLDPSRTYHGMDIDDDISNDVRGGGGFLVK